MKLLALFVAIAITFNMVYADTIATVSFGACPSSLPVISSFSPQAYVGIWYEVKRFPTFYEYGMRCVTAQYGYINMTSVSVRNTGILSSGVRQITDGTAYIPNPSAPNKLIVVFPRNLLGFNFGSTEGSYNVIDTDYNNYSLVYSCSNDPLKIIKIEYAWVLSRSRTLDATSLSKVYSALTNLGVNTNFFVDTVQTGC